MLSKFKQMQGRGNAWALWLTLALVAALLAGGFSAVSVQAGPAPELFGDAGDAGADLDYRQPGHVTRTRYVNVNLGQLVDAGGKALDIRVNPQVTLNLFPDASFTGIMESVKKDPETGISWTGRLKEDPGGYFYLVLVDDVFIAHVASLSGVYEVSWAADNLYRVVQIDQSRLGEDYPRKMDPPGPIFTVADLGPEADSGATIDIMVIYTDDARVGEGSTAAMKARIALALTETNTAYAHSAVTPRLRLVHVHELGYAETGNMGTDLNRLINNGDGILDAVHSLRNTYGADMVSLVVENGGSYCGLAAAIMASASNAFQVTARDGCMTGYYSFGHEFGHLQGARHDTYVDPTNTPYIYGHGYVHKHATVASQRWRTVMAYNTACADAGYYCNRLQYFSNPVKTYLGAPMGVVNSSEVYKVLNTTRVTVANFKTAKIGTNFNSNFNTNATGWSAVNGVWSLVNSAIYRSAGIVGKSVSIKHTGKYGDITYQARIKGTGSCNDDCDRGLIFRGNPNSLNATKDWYSSYYFGYYDSGDYYVVKTTGAGEYVTLKARTSSAAINTNDWNVLKVVAVGNSLKFYINGTQVWSGNNASYKVGQVGVYFYRHSTSTDDYINIDWAKLSTTATADINLFDQAALDLEIPGAPGFHGQP